jgi:hypothetical protein
VSYLWHCTDDLHSHFLACPNVKCLHNFAKRALTKKLYQIISFAQLAIFLNNVVSVFIVNLVVSPMTLHKDQS